MMEMPTPCQACGDLFDLLDGKESKLWCPGTTICNNCSDEEKEEIAAKDEIMNEYSEE